MKAFTGAAAAIGRRLVTEAIWHEDRCTWIGGRAGGERGDEHEATLDPWLYEGTSGVALFLAELHQVRPEPGARDTALGAMRHALRHAPPAGRGLGLYVGIGGVALVAARIGRLLDEEGLRDAARHLLRQVGPARHDNGHDLLSGAAGTIIALLALAHEFDDSALVAAAAGLGSALVAAGRAGPGLSWKSDPAISRRPLTGLSHGAAGVGFALVQLGAVTGERRFGEAALQAFEYERAQFERREGNWPDLRATSRSSGPPVPGFMSAWCHGGPGIALSRLCGFELLGDHRCLEDAQIGLALARASLDRDVRSDYSLCHGTAGNAEIVAEGAAALGGDGAVAASAAMARGANLHGQDVSWPCGVTGHSSPGLMLGLAGIGRCLLRLSGVPLPSVLRIDGVATQSKIGEDRPNDRPQGFR